MITSKTKRHCCLKQKHQQQQPIAISNRAATVDLLATFARINKQHGTSTYTYTHIYTYIHSHTYSLILALVKIYIENRESPAAIKSATISSTHRRNTHKHTPQHKHSYNKSSNINNTIPLRLWNHRSVACSRSPASPHRALVIFTSTNQPPPSLVVQLVVRRHKQTNKQETKL